MVLLPSGSNCVRLLLCSFGAENRIMVEDTKHEEDELMHGYQAEFDAASAAENVHLTEPTR